MVSASKMKRAQQQALSARPYSLTLQSTLQKIAMHTDSNTHRLLQKNDEGMSVLVVIATNRGLCGGLNTNLFKTAIQWLDMNPGTQLIVVGEKAQQFFSKTQKQIIASYTDFPENIHYNDTLALSNLLLDSFIKKEFDKVYIAYMDFISTLSQQPKIDLLLPFQPEQIRDPADLIEESSEYEFEPNSHTILDWLLPYAVRNNVYHSMLEAKASEHSARMIAMKSASDNAKEVVEALQLEFNKTRQAAITQELQEITTAALTLE